MKQIRRIAAGVVAGLMFAGMAYAGHGEKIDCDAPANAAKKMMDGNKNFCGDKCSTKNIGDSRRKELAKGQKPFAIVVTCSDSRVAPEYIFDQGLGDIFVIRVAGNVVDPIAIGSIEYAAEHLGSPLLIVLGHQSCGAVGAAIDSNGDGEGNIGAILKKIKPAVEAANASGKKDAEKLNFAVQENVKNVGKDILANSPIVKELIHEGRLKMMLAEYYLDSGKVETIEQAADAHAGHAAEPAAAGAHH